jgi:flagellar biosynthesis protein FlhG
MNDQATTLRQMAIPKYGVKPVSKKTPPSTGEKHARSIAVTGGKGGVGKSNVSVNLAIELAAAGWKVTLLDADLALANADVLLGINPQYHLGHVLSGQRSLDQVVIETNGVRLIPAGSGIEDLANLTQAQHRRLIAELSAMEDESDFLIIDTPAGIAHNVTSVLQAASEVIVVTTPDPTAVIDAYATIKVLHQYSPDKQISVCVNDVVGIGDAEQTFAQIQTACTRFLQHPVEHIGTIPRDAELAEAVRRQIPVVDYAPQTPASRSLRLIAKRLDQSRRTATVVKPQTQSFWQMLSQVDGQ